MMLTNKNSPQIHEKTCQSSINQGGFLAFASFCYRTMGTKGDDRENLELVLRYIGSEVNIR